MYLHATVISVREVFLIELNNFHIVEAASMLPLQYENYHWY
jgi:hypothetical protein